MTALYDSQPILKSFLFFNILLCINWSIRPEIHVLRFPFSVFLNILFFQKIVMVESTRLEINYSTTRQVHTF